MMLLRLLLANLLVLLTLTATRATELRDAQLLATGSPVLENDTGTLRLEDGRFSTPVPLPEPGALGRLGPGVGLVLLLGYARRGCGRSSQDLRRGGRR